MTKAQLARAKALAKQAREAAATHKNGAGSPEAVALLAQAIQLERAIAEEERTAARAKTPAR